MKTILPALHNKFAKAAIIGKLLVFISTLLFCFSISLYAGVNPNKNKHFNRHIKKVGSNLPKDNLASGLVVPTISYSGPQVYTAGTAITALSPTSSGVAAVAYDNVLVNISTGLIGPRGLAVDVAGNVYVADYLGGQVKKIPVGGGAPVILGSGFSHPMGVAVDPAGNVYVADLGSTDIKMIPVGGGVPVIIATGFSNPFGIAIDLSGNLYVADYGNKVVKMIPAAGGTPVIIGSGFNNVACVTVDAAGNVYAGDSGDHAIYEIPAGGGAKVVIGSGPASPYGITVDGAGNIYIADGISNLVKKIPAGGGAPVMIGSGSDTMTGVAIDASGNLYVSEFGGKTVNKISVVGGYHINKALPAGLTFDSATGVISGTPTISSPATNYIVTAFNGSGSSQTTVNIKVNAVNFSYNNPQTYITTTTIAPLAPTGSGVTAAGYSNSPVNIGSVFNKPRSLAMDAMGNIYVADYGSNSIKKIPAGGGAPVLIASGVGTPVGIALDTAGNIYVADYNGNAIRKIPAGGGAIVTVGSGFLHPNGVAVDGAGNIFVADNGNQAMKKIPVAGGAVINLGTYTNLLGVATDAAGNVYFAEKSNGVIYKLPVAGGLPFIIASGFTNPLGLAVDAAGNLFVADASITTILELPALGNTLVPISSGFNFPASVITDAAGNLYVADYLNNAVKKIKPTGGYYINALPAGLNFDNATGIISGTPAVASPATDYFVTAYNSFGSNAAAVNIKVDLLPLPVINYISSSKPYAVNNAITPMPPQSSGVAAPGYSTSPFAFRSGLNNPLAVAVDNTGRVFFAEAGINMIRSAAPGNNNTFTAGSGYNYPGGVAVDGINMYVADQLNNVIKKNNKNGGSSVIIGSGFNNPCAVAVDALGNVYVADKGNNAIKKIPVGGGAIITIGSGFNQPSGVAVDAAGNVYVADYGNNAIKMIPVGGGSPIILGSGFSQPNGVAVDASGYIYIADTGNNTIEKMPAGGGTPVVISTAIVHPLGIAINEKGVLYVVDNLNSRILEIKPVGGYYVNTPLPAGLIIDNVTGIISGTPLVQSPYQYYYVLAYNNTGDSGFHVVPIQVDLLPPPAIGYSTPKSFTKNIAITPLVPVSTNVSVVGYNNSPATMGSGFALPVGVAVDAKGNVYVADKGNGLLKKIAKVGGAITNIGSGFNDPSGVTVDGAGNVYVADNVKNKVYKVPVDGGATVVIGTGFSSPAGIAIDSTGNIYVADNGGNAIKKIPFDGSAIVTIGSGFSSPAGVTVDVSGNVYVADAGNNAIKKIPAGGGAPVTIGSGFNQPLGVAVDAGGNVYVGDFNNNAVKIIPAGGGATVSIGSGFNHPYGVAVDASGNVYTSDYLNNAVKKIIPVGGYFIGPALPQGLNFDNNTGVISGTPVVVSPATDYTVTGYNISASSSAKLNITVNLLPPPTVSYSGPQVYKTGKVITPLAPVSSGVTAPGFSSTPSVISSVGTPNALTVDAAGNIYMADHADNTIKKIPANGGSPVIVGSGFTTPNGVAVDAAGNVYVADLNSSSIKMIPVGGGAQVAVGSGFSNPYGVAADAAGNIFVADYNGSSAYKIPAGGGAQVKIATIGTPTGIALDGVGNVYIAGFSLSIIKKFPADGSPSVTIGSGLNQVFGVAADNFGNVFLADYSTTTIKEIPAGGGVPIILASDFVHPIGMALDAFGNIYVSDIGSQKISKLGRTGGYYINPVLPAGLNFDNNTGIISGTPTVASPATSYTITAYNSSGGSAATVNIKTIVATSNATLSALIPSSGTLSPVFAAATISYTAIVPNATTSIKITPIAGDVNATIKVNGTTVAPGAASASLPLVVGTNAITTIVTASDGTTTKTYTVTVTRAASGLSTNALLTSIKINPVTTLVTVSGPGFKNYTTDVPNSETSLAVTSILQDATATIKVNGITVASNVASPAIPLIVGNNVINVVVTAQDGASTKTYIISATRAQSSNANLASFKISSGTLSPVFTAATTSYTAIVVNAVSSITVTPATGDATASVKVNGTAVTSGAASAAQPLVVGINTITTVVTAQNGTTIKTYTLTITRANSVSTNALLTSIKVSPVTALAAVPGPAFRNYTTAVPNSEASLQVIAVVQDATATIKVNGVISASGVASQVIPLNVGNNVINTVVTAQDGLTTNSYIITATRAPSAIATLANFAISSGTLSPVFASATSSYTASVGSAIASITVTPTISAAGAIVKVNGTIAASGAASASIPLAVGTNTITTVVTAQDGITTKTYTLTVTRPSALSANALLTSLKLTPATPLVTVSGPGFKNYTSAIPNSETSLQVTAIVQDATATIKVNGTAVASGAASPAIPLVVGSNVVNVTVTAQDGTTTNAYIITATRAPASMALKYVENPADSLKVADDGIVVHQAVSPNGDGKNDVLTIDGLTKYPDNKLTIMNAGGIEIYRASGYDNANKVFDGHSNKTMTMQKPGTYFYQLEYTDKGKTKYKTGYILLKY
ncbi:cadherin-like beta sandwich domain-containing protein [Mucilaginibacter sp.]|uniref:cadherin-like beta sandwich domain-containing protein n=1 Tax=Mucilaginibacter sp. TaxID=1882438 RepID=UPI00260C2106|nr:cadherin-like beta sandwich domain-containing protein [Mucilaginibacter sp.]